MFEYFKVARRVSVLEEALTRLTRVIDARDLDWVDMKARCKRLLDRTEKAQRALESSEPGDGQETPAVAGNGGGTSPGRFLTPHQLAVQQQILKRRVGL